MHTQTENSAMEDEISLIELWDILAQRKYWILACVAVSLAAAGAYLLIKAPVYEASVKVRIGQVAGAGPFESPEFLSSRLLAEYGETIADGVTRERPFLKQASVPKNLPSAVELVTEGNSPQDAVDLLERIHKGIDASHQKTYAFNLRYLTERITNLETQRTSLEHQLTDATALMEQLKQQNAVQASLVMLERGRLATAITTLDAERPALAQKLSSPQTQPTELIGSIQTPTKPAAPKRALVLALATVLGTMAGVMLALVQAFVQNARLRNAESAQSMRR